MTAGYATTATTLGHIIYHMAKFPEAQQRAFDEIEAVCEDGREVNQDTIGDMHYVEAVIMETLRLTPAIIGQERICTKDCQVKGNV